jgi:hypothetical protein
MESIREIVIPENNKIELTIPDNFIGKKIEVLAFELEEKQKLSRSRRKRSFNAIALDLTEFKFNRE